MSKNIPSLINWSNLKNLVNRNDLVKIAAKEDSGMDESGNMNQVTDREDKEFNPRKGLEGPYLNKDRKAYYYDNKEGKYYCPYMDMYLDAPPEREKAASVKDLNAFKFACKINGHSFDGIILEKTAKQAISEFSKMIKNAGIDYSAMEYDVKPFKLNILEVLKTAYRADMPKMSLQDVADRLIEATMTGKMETMPVDESNKISQLISQLNILVDTMSKVVGEPLDEEEVIEALNNAAKNRGAEVEIGSLGSGPEEAYLNFDKSKLIDNPKKAQSDDITKEAKKKSKKSSSGRKPTKPSLWSRAKSMAKKKFDVYPSAYANLWASKWYKQHGGGWRKSSK